MRANNGARDENSDPTGQALAQARARSEYNSEAMRVLSQATGVETASRVPHPVTVAARLIQNDFPQLWQAAGDGGVDAVFATALRDLAIQIAGSAVGVRACDQDERAEARRQARDERIKDALRFCATVRHSPRAFTVSERAELYAVARKVSRDLGIPLSESLAREINGTEIVARESGTCAPHVRSDRKESVDRINGFDVAQAAEGTRRTRRHRGVKRADKSLAVCQRPNCGGRIEAVTSWCRRCNRPS